MGGIISPMFGFDQKENEREYTMKWKCNSDCEYYNIATRCSVTTDSLIGKPTFCTKFARTCEWIPETQNVVASKKPLSKAEESVFESLKQNVGEENITPKEVPQNIPKLTQEIFKRVKKDHKWICATTDKNGRAYFWSCVPTLFSKGGSWQSSLTSKEKVWREIKGKFDSNNWEESLIFRGNRWCEVGRYVYYNVDNAYVGIVNEGFARIEEVYKDCVKIQSQNHSFIVKPNKLRPAYSVPWNFYNGPVLLKVRNKENKSLGLALLSQSGNGYRVKDGDPLISFSIFHDEYEQIDGMPCGELKTGKE